jgi:CubicO group peptidase (beta-lactamase class C family)
VSGIRRPLPARPSLRFAKIEAKRRVAAGEFPALHAAQTAIAREYGLSTWAAFKRLCADVAAESYALAQLEWIIGRFQDADRPGWTPPDAGAIREHFHDQVLAAVPADHLVAQLTGAAPHLRERLVVVDLARLRVRVRLGGLEVFVAVAADPPHPITALTATALASGISDARVTEPGPVRTTGPVPAGVAEIVAGSVAELGLPGLGVAGAGPEGTVWTATAGRPDLDGDQPLDVHHQFPAYGVAGLVTATAVLRLVADGRIGLDTPVNAGRRSLRLADDSITVREVLSHSGGVDSPAPGAMFADRVPDLVSLLGPVVGCSGPRGAVQPSNGGYAVLGQLVADLTDTSYTDAVTRLVLDPIGLTGATLPTRDTDLGLDAVTGYQLTGDGVFQPAAMICTIPAVGGLWATPTDLVRLGLGWTRLLPAELVQEALTAQTPLGAGGRAMGLGWLLSPDRDVGLHAGSGPGATAALLYLTGGQVRVIVTNRAVPLDTVTDRLLHQ